MANWCYHCARKPYIGCDPDCPIFGKHLEDVAEDYFKLKTESEPVKHGRWERLTYVMGWAKCSNCESTWELEKINAFNMDYCPNCGAKMDKSHDATIID